MMRELPELLAALDTISHSGFFAPSAPGATTGQSAQATASTFFLYGYLIGEEVDTLLCGHPNLVY